MTMTHLFFDLPDPLTEGIVLPVDGDPVGLEEIHQVLPFIDPEDVRFILLLALREGKCREQVEELGALLERAKVDCE